VTADSGQKEGRTDGLTNSHEQGRPYYVPLVLPVKPVIQPLGGLDGQQQTKVNCQQHVRGSAQPPRSAAATRSKQSAVHSLTSAMTSLGSRAVR